jgi:hypothetical protein
LLHQGPQAWRELIADRPQDAAEPLPDFIADCARVDSVDLQAAPVLVNMSRSIRFHPNFSQLALRLVQKR